MAVVVGAHLSKFSVSTNLGSVNGYIYTTRTTKKNWCKVSLDKPASVVYNEMGMLKCSCLSYIRSDWRSKGLVVIIYNIIGVLNMEYLLYKI